MPQSRLLQYRNQTEHLVAGVMSGTSLDGVDVAIVRLHDTRSMSGDGGSLRWELAGFTGSAFQADLRQRLFDACSGTSDVRTVFELHAQLGHAYADAVARAVDAAGLDRPLDAVGLHGQTIYHAPGGGPLAVTVQIGCGAVLAEQLDVLVVDDFRSNDIAAGGHGAPLVPYCDLLMLRSDERSRVALNVGGIANLTWLPRGVDAATLVAFDTGPGNMLIDAAMRALYGQEYDRDGTVAASAGADEDWLQDLMDDPYFSEEPPKSSGRERYGAAAAAAALSAAAHRGLSAPVVIATLTALTARSIGRACRVHAARGLAIDELIVSGGGARNRAMLGMLAQELPGTRVCTSDDCGIPAQAKESMCFAILAHEALFERPANVPSVTGAARPVVCGAIRVP